MSERKVLNKYYPIDFEFFKLPKLEKGRPKQYVVRLMAPFTMRCNACGEYIYHGRKFNARKETVEGERYLGIPIFRFYIRCTRCLSEITFKTDPKNTDYVPEHGAVRTFQAERVAEKMAENERKEKEEEEANDPMLALENRTRDSKYEMDVLDALEEIKDQNARFEQVDLNQLLTRYKEEEQRQLAKQEEEDEALVQSVFSRDQVHRLNDEAEEEGEKEEESGIAAASTSSTGSKRAPTDILVAEGGRGEPEAPQIKKKKKEDGEEREEARLSSKTALSALVKRPNKGKGALKTTVEDKPSSQSTSKPVEEVPSCQPALISTGSSDTGVTSDMSVSQVTPSLVSHVSPKPSGLGLLGSYSSDSDNDSTHS